eukprot:sb/3462012/
MSRPVRLSHTNCDVSRFFNNTTYNRSIKLWVNNVSFTCSRLVLAKHSTVFEHHLRDSPPSLLLEDFQGEEGVEDAIQDALVLMYGGAVVLTPRNISVIARFATLYTVEELLNTVLEWVNTNLTVENVMPLFTALRTVEASTPLSIKLWVNNVSFTCSRLVLAKHSTVFEHHLRDSPPSLLLEDFQGEEGVEDAIQDALVLMYGGAVVLTPRNISVIARFATLYTVEELLNTVLEWVNTNLTVENVMPLFTALRTVEADGSVNVPEVVRRYMERNTGPIVDHLLSIPSKPENDEFLLSMLELPSSSVLVQKCLKAGNLPDPIVDLIFKNSSTINVNFLLHDDKRTYVRLISILKSKARTYADMERIIDIQQKCIARMAGGGGRNPYGSFDSIAPGNLVTAPSLATMVAGPPKPISGVTRSPHRTGEEYFPRREEQQQRGFREEEELDEGEYMEPEEVKMMRKSRGPSRENTVRNGRNHHHHGNPPQQHNILSPRGDGARSPRGGENNNHHHHGNPPGGMVTSSRGEAFMTSSNNPPPPPIMTSSSARNAKMPPAVVAQLKNNLEKKFVPKSQDRPYMNDVDRGMGRLNLSSAPRSLTSPPPPEFQQPPPPDPSGPPTKYAEVYVKRTKSGGSKELKESSVEQRDHNTEALREATVSMNRQSEMIADALTKLAEQQAFIEHTYDNMSILSGGKDGVRSRGEEQQQHKSPSLSENPRDLGPTTFGTRVPSTRSLQRAVQIPPEPPSEPPPGSSYYPRPPVLNVPPPPPPEDEINLEDISAIDFASGVGEMSVRIAPQQQKIQIPDLRGRSETRGGGMSKEELLRHSHVLINKGPNKSRDRTKSRERTKERASMRKKKGKR